MRSAYRLWFDALSGSAADEEGQLDMNVLTGGTSAKQASFIANELPHLLRGILTGKQGRLCVEGEVHSSFGPSTARLHLRSHNLW